jgi:hypothetical protein
LDSSTLPSSYDSRCERAEGARELFRDSSGTGARAAASVSVGTCAAASFPATAGIAATASTSEFHALSRSLGTGQPPQARSAIGSGSSASGSGSNSATSYPYGPITNGARANAHRAIYLQPRDVLGYDSTSLRCTPGARRSIHPNRTIRARCRGLPLRSG